jgi:hypothetical protein
METTTQPRRGVVLLNQILTVALAVFALGWALKWEARRKR